MRNSFLWISLFGVLVLASACSKSYYLSSDFKKTAQQHQHLAVVPTEMVLTGVMPENLSKNDLLALEEAESVAFQTSLFNQLLRNPKAKRKNVYVDFMSVDKTNELLAEKGVNIRDSWKKTPQELAQLLGVDAVVRARVEKTRYMSDLVSMGLNLGKKLLNVLTGFKSAAFIPGDIDKTSDIHARCQAVDSEGGNVLWSMTLTAETDWNDPATEVVDGISYKMAKTFPYRAK